MRDTNHYDKLEKLKDEDKYSIEQLLNDENILVVDLRRFDTRVKDLENKLDNLIDILEIISSQNIRHRI